MKGFAAVLRLELYEKRIVLALGAALALIPWILPVVPGLSRLGPAELRTASSVVLGIGFALGGALLLGGTLLSPDLASGRLAFPLARPVSAAALLCGRLVAAALVVALASAAILAAAFLSGFAGEPAVAALPLWLLAPIALGLALAANAAAVAFRSRSPWLVVDVVLTPVTVLVVWASARALRLAGAEALLRNLLAGFAAVLVAALLVGAYAQLQLGRTNRLRAHGALSLTVWSFLVPAVLATWLFTRWVVSPAPVDLIRPMVTEAAPRGSWIAVRGIARHRGGMEAAFLFDTRTGRFVRLGHGDVAFADDGARALVARADGRTFELSTVDLASSRPELKRTGITAAAFPTLALSHDGRRAALLADGTLSVYDLGSATLEAAAQTPSIGAGVEILFSADRVRLVPRWYPNGDQSRAPGARRSPATTALLPIRELDLRTRTLRTVAEVEASIPTSFQTSPDGSTILVSEHARERVSLLDAATGAARPGGIFAGFSRGAFLSDGRIALLREVDIHGVGLAIASPDGRIVDSYQLRSNGTLAFVGELEPGLLGISSLHTTRPCLYLVDLSQKSVRELPGLAPSGASLFIGPLPAGSDAVRIFRTASGIVALEPRTGATRGVLPPSSP